jgi:hypothetical protein
MHQKLHKLQKNLITFINSNHFFFTKKRLQLQMGKKIFGFKSFKTKTGYTPHGGSLDVISINKSLLLVLFSHDISKTFQSKTFDLLYMSYIFF